jgi:hypothetical protein
MTIDFTCQKCEGSFELEAEDLLEGIEKLACPHCNNKATSTMVDDFTSAITELRRQVATLAKKFTVSLTIESDELAEDLEEEEEEADEDSDEELDFDDDEELEEEDDLEDEDLER